MNKSIIYRYLILPISIAVIVSMASTKLYWFIYQDGYIAAKKDTIDSFINFRDTCENSNPKSSYKFFDNNLHKRLSTG